MAPIMSVPVIAMLLNGTLCHQNGTSSISNETTNPVSPVFNGTSPIYNGTSRPNNWTFPAYNWTLPNGTHIPLGHGPVVCIGALPCPSQTTTPSLFSSPTPSTTLPPTQTPTTSIPTPTSASSASPLTTTGHQAEIATNPPTATHTATLTITTTPSKPSSNPLFSSQTQTTLLIILGAAIPTIGVFVALWCNHRGTHEHCSCLPCVGSRHEPAASSPSLQQTPSFTRYRIDIENGYSGDGRISPVTVWPGSRDSSPASGGWERQEVRGEGSGGRR